MTWKPIHEAHSIDNVRIILQLKEALPDKILNRITAPLSERFQDLGFDSIAPADSATARVVVSVDNQQATQMSKKNGVVLQKLEGQRILEEAGYRDSTFGFMSFEYARWAALQNRFWELFEESLEVAIDATDIASIKLEYWDRFFFDGALQTANAYDLLENIDPFIPQSNITGEALWHSHIGWFETYKDHTVLVNRNIQAVDETHQLVDNADESADQADQEDAKRRVVKLYTLVELRFSSETVGIAFVKEGLQHLHDRSLGVFSQCLIGDVRARLGIDEKESS